MTKWDKRWMQLVGVVSSWSKDDSRTVGCVIIDKRNTVVALGWNGIPRSVDDTIPHRNVKPQKDLFTEHAERNAIYNAASTGTTLRDCIIYCNLMPCASCARGIIQCCITEVIVPKLPEIPDVKYENDFIATRKMFNEAGVTLRELEI